jgi:hypothetical protein
MGVVAVIALKHVGLLLLVGSPLVGSLNVARVRVARIWRKHHPRAGG